MSRCITTDDLDVVTVRIQYVGAVVARVVLRPQARPAVVPAARGQRRCMERIHVQHVSSHGRPDRPLMAEKRSSAAQRLWVARSYLASAAALYCVDASMPNHPISERETNFESLSVKPGLDRNARARGVNEGKRIQETCGGTLARRWLANSHVLGMGRAV